MWVLFTLLTTCCFSDVQSASPGALSAWSPSSRQWVDWAHSGFCWCVCASGRDPLHQRWALLNQPIHCCRLSLWNPGNLNSAWKEGKKVSDCSSSCCSCSRRACVPVQRAVCFHWGRLTEGANPAQHILLSVSAEEIRTHSLVHHLDRNASRNINFHFMIYLLFNWKYSYDYYY